MSRGYRVLWAEDAERDLRGILEFIARDSPSAALGVLHSIRESASRLEILPERGRIVPELRDQGITIYRELIVAPWRVMYRISGDEVHVLVVLDSRRNAEDILLKRLVDS